MSVLTIFGIAATFLAFLQQNYPNGFKELVKTIRSEELLDVYDFIIVGGGSAGSTLANRLTEISEWNVLLIEAGGQENFWTETPAMFPALQHTPVDWNYTTTVQSVTCQATGGRCPYPRGRVLGGSSGINAMIYTRGYRSDYDRWGVLNCGWSFRDLEPYFLQSEGNTIPGLIGHGRNGPLTVGYPSYRSPLAAQLIRAGVAKGLRNTDCPNYESDCIYRLMSTIRNGQRCSASRAFLEPASQERPNLHIITEAEVSKIIIENNVAKGVEFNHRNGKTTVMSSKEVIISSGAIGSPKILMLSGIGPRQHLESLGIQVKADLPVGDNLQDHNRVPLYFRLSENITSPLESLEDTSNMEQYRDSLTGPYSAPGVETLAWVRVGSAYNKLVGIWEPPNVQFHFFTRSAVAGDSVAVASVTVVRPRSRGTIRLNATDRMGDPLIDVNYYGDQDDWQVTYDGMRFLHDLFHSRPFVGTQLDTSFQPDCANSTNLQVYLNCIIKFYTYTMYHPVGTVKMAGILAGGVVNRRLQVYGVKNLRVIDASIAPTLISMNTNAMAIMIGEKGADLIKVKYGRTPRQTVRACKSVPYKNPLSAAFNRRL